MGTKKTEEAKELISKALKGRLFSTESKTKMQEVAKLRQGIKTFFLVKVILLKKELEFLLQNLLLLKLQMLRWAHTKLLEVMHKQLNI